MGKRDQDNANNNNKAGQLFEVKDGLLYKVLEKQTILVSNFILKIDSQKVRTDEGIVKEREFVIHLNIKEKEFSFTISSEDIFKGNLPKKIQDVTGCSAITYGSGKDLWIAAQEMSAEKIPEKIVTSSLGLTPEGNYLSKNILIKPDGIITNPDIEVDLSKGNFCKNLGFLISDRSELQMIGKHLLEDFLELKKHAITYPLMGHIALAPFTSVLSELTGKKKSALHMLGPSGCGKTFLGTLAISFFGSFDDHYPSWTSTINALEAEGFYFRDSLFFIDDYKASCVDQKTVISIMQKYSEGHGRSRLKPNSQIRDVPYIRGLLLSTGEDFVADIESILGRTIVLQVEPKKNLQAGKNCWDHHNDYRAFSPGLIQNVISKNDWKNSFKEFAEVNIIEFTKKTKGISNGLRIASNWALNALGFELFIEYLTALKVIDEEKKARMSNEYTKIVHSHLEEQVSEILSKSPTEVFFRLLSEKMATGKVSVTGLNNGLNNNHGKLIGQLKKDENLIYIYPGASMEVIVSHFRSVAQRLPFTRNALRDALAREKLITRAKKGRWSKQVRGAEGSRFQCWEFDANKFKERCGL